MNSNDGQQGWRTSSQRRNYHGSNGNAWGQQQQSQRPGQHGAVSSGTGYFDGHVPVNGYNAKEVEEMLARGYEQQLQAARNGPDGDRPVVYKTEKAWTSTTKGSGGGAAWGNRAHAMANGGNFLTALRKSVMSGGNTEK